MIGGQNILQRKLDLFFILFYLFIIIIVIYINN